MTKAYYFPASRAIVTGTVLVLIGLSPIYGTMLIEHSVKAGLWFFTAMFTGFPEIILALMLLVILLSGVLYLINARSIVRLKLDDDGVHYLPFGESYPSQYRLLFNLFYLKSKFKFIPYTQIAKAEYVADKPYGYLVNLQLKNGQNTRLLTAPFSQADKHEAVDLINLKIGGTNASSI